MGHRELNRFERVAAIITLALIAWIITVFMAEEGYRFLVGLFQ